MLGITDFGVFLGACILLNLTPGQDTLYIVGRSAAQGRAAGLLSVLGIMSGVLVHTVLAAFGLSAVLVASSAAFGVVKLLGAGYLVWIGVGMLVGREAAGGCAGGAAGPLDPWRLYREGLFTNLFNPKVALFFLSFLPQFVDPRSGAGPPAFLALGAVFFTTGILWCLVLVAGASGLSRGLRRGLAGRVLRRAAGALFIGLGVRLAFSRSP